MMIMGGWIPAGGGWNPKLGLSGASEASDGNLGDQMIDTSPHPHASSNTILLAENNLPLE